LATDVEEREVAGFTVRIDRLLCVGFGDCIEAAPDVFVFDDEGIATFVTPTSAPDPDHLRGACDVCPVDALTLLDGDGTQVVP
jgi:ferredoxin